MGWAIDWPREVSTHEPEYYRWTQWLFLQLTSRARLAQRRRSSGARTTRRCLRTSRSIDGRCERCGARVESRNIAQWFFKTTGYADQLLDVSALRWPERVVAVQRHWIGRSEGAEVLFELEELGEDVPVFTTRPDTLFGATFFVLAPEHPLVERFIALGGPRTRSCASTCGTPRRRSAGKRAPPGRRAASTPASSPSTP